MIDKHALRRSFSAARKKVPPSERAIAAGRVSSLVCELVAHRHASTVACFASYGHELTTTRLLTSLRVRGVRVLLPRVEGTGTSMTFCDYTDLGGLAPDRFGIPSPDGAACTDPMDLMLLPGLAFGRDGSRLGYGAGFYDRYLSSLDELPPVRCGLGFDCQVVAELPSEAHDILLTHIAVPSGLITCKLEGDDPCDGLPDRGGV